MKCAKWKEGVAVCARRTVPMHNARLNRPHRPTETDAAGVLYLDELPPFARRVIELLWEMDPERVYLFGSWARGDADELSDLDIVIIRESNLPFLDRLREAAQRLPADVGAVDLLV